WSTISNSTSAAVTQVLSVSISTHAYNFGSVNVGATTVSTTAVTVTNGGNITETYSLSVATTGALSVWAVGSSTPTAFDTFALFGAFHPSQPVWTGFGTTDVITGVSAASTATKYSIDGSQTGLNVPVSYTRALWFFLNMPLSVSTTDQEQMNVT